MPKLVVTNETAGEVIEALIEWANKIERVHGSASALIAVLGVFGFPSTPVESPTAQAALPSHVPPPYYWLGTPLVNGKDQRGSLLITDGWKQGLFLRQGDSFILPHNSNFQFTLTEDCHVVDDLGSATLLITPSLDLIHVFNNEVIAASAATMRRILAPSYRGIEAMQ